MKQGDFSKVAKFYHNRPAYNYELIKNILKCANFKDDFCIAEVGAGTGKLTAILKELAPKAKIVAVEPNDEMRDIGQKTVENVTWIKGSGEDTKLQNDSADILFMASSFHWTDPTLSLPEFKRILKKDGYFCALWNPREIEKGTVFDEIECEIKNILPNLNRVSSGTQNSKNWIEVIQSTKDFKDCMYMAMPYIENMSKERYIGAWQSVNDIQAQAGGGSKWNEILKMIEDKISGLDELKVKYTIKAYLAKSTK